MINEYEPQTVSHPGSSLNEKLQEMQMSQEEFAFVTGSSEETVNKIINGECTITPDMAVRFERVLKIPVDFWLRRQHIYDEMFSKDKSVNALMLSS